MKTKQVMSDEDLEKQERIYQSIEHGSFGKVLKFISTAFIVGFVYILLNSVNNIAGGIFLGVMVAFGVIYFLLIQDGS